MHEKHTLGNHITFDTAEDERKKFVKYIMRTEASHPEIDLMGVESCDSAGIALLIEIYNIGIKYNKKVNFINEKQHIKSLATFCRVQDFLFA